VLTSVNTILHQRQLEEYYCTLCYAVFDLKRHILSVSNSGLPYPVRWSAGTASQIELPGVPLGSFHGITYDELSLALHAGDVFVFCSDGVFEAMNEEGGEFTAARVIEVVNATAHLPAQKIVEAIFASVESWRNGALPNDDMTAVAVRITA
jgi:sigma-B regulation protein RsbU (phosphoserine phosphatase)